MNAVMERWIQTCRRELLDRTLIYTQRHLLHALKQYERHYNDHRPHRGINNARPVAAAAYPDHQPGHDRAPQRPPSRSPQRTPSRVRTRRLTCPDGVFGTHRVRWGPAPSCRHIPNVRALLGHSAVGALGRPHRRFTFGRRECRCRW
jgi:hypothetical protein